MECGVTTRSLRPCSRAARFCYLRDGVVIAVACTQHDRGQGVARMLLPFWWEYDAVLDLASGVTTDLRAVAPEGMSR